MTYDFVYGIDKILGNDNIYNGIWLPNEIYGKPEHITKMKIILKTICLKGE